MQFPGGAAGYIWYPKNTAAYDGKVGLYRKRAL